MIVLKTFDEALNDLFKAKPYKQEKQKPLPNHFEGERINHLRFGNGTIKTIKGEKCAVLFDSGIEKSLLIRFARFSKATHTSL